MADGSNSAFEGLNMESISNTESCVGLNNWGTFSTPSGKNNVPVSQKERR